VIYWLDQEQLPGKQPERRSEVLIDKHRRRGNLVCIATTAGQMQAQVLKSKLELAGIPVLLEYESAGLVFGLTVDGLGEVRVMVPAEMEEEAQTLIEPEDTPLADDSERATDG
jgi:hypothetical protein